MQLEAFYQCAVPIMGGGLPSALQQPETAALIAQIQDLLQRCKSIAKTVKLTRPTKGLSPADPGLLPPPRHVADVMVSLYFEAFESTHRILHISSFWSEYHRYWECPEVAPLTLRLKILLVTAIGSSIYEGDTDTNIRRMVRSWIYTAQDWLAASTAKENKAAITEMQIHCLAVFARQIFSIDGDQVWTSLGSLIHRAMRLGLHRDPKHLPSMSVLHAELRRRLWATILELTVQASLDSEMPPRICLDEFDTEPPSNVNDSDLDESTIVVQSRANGVYTSASLQILLLKSFPMRLRILKLMFGLPSDISYLDVLALSDEMTGMHRTCSRFLLENAPNGVTTFHRNLFSYTMHWILLSLHCPFANKARSNPLLYFSLKTSIDKAMAIISPEPDQAFGSLMAIGGGLCTAAIKYAMATIGVELLTQVDAQGSEGGHRSNSLYIEQLTQALRKRLAFSAERIRNGETKVKTHMFLSMMLAQVEATQAGTSRELEIASSARDSLEMCHDLLQRRIAATTLLDPEGTGLTPISLEGGQDAFGLDLDLDFLLPDANFI